MKLFIHDALFASPNLGEELAQEREFRRSTRSILKGVALIRSLFERNQWLKPYLESKRVAFLAATSIGEIEITRDFLKDFVLNDTARPFLFQLSSHNSTAGFLAQYFALKGPSITFSNGYQGTEAALESSWLLLESGSCDLSIVFSFDQSIEGWVDLKTYEKYPQLKASSGASLLLLSKNGSYPSDRKVQLADLDFSKPTQDEVAASNFYDSNLGEELARLVQEHKTGAYRFVRPDSTMTTFSLHEDN